MGLGSNHSQGDSDDDEASWLPRSENGAEYWLNEKAQLTLLQRALDAGGVAIAVLNMAEPDLPIVYANRGFEALTGYSELECRNRSWECLLDHGLKETAVEHLRHAIQKGVEAKSELIFRRRDGSAFWSEFRAIPLRNERDQTLHCVTVFRDTTATRMRMDVLHHRATHDALTGLANRSLFMEKLHSAIAESKDLGRTFGVAFIDVDSFKAVNDRYGHLIGDELLKLIALRIARQLRAHDLAARLGGDEFALLLTHLHSDDSTLAVFQRITAALNEPYVLDGLVLEVGCSTGISLYPTDGNDAVALVRNADLGMYRGKNYGMNYGMKKDPESNQE